jgi:hypothetical protein
MGRFEVDSCHDNEMWLDLWGLLLSGSALLTFVGFAGLSIGILCCSRDQSLREARVADLPQSPPWEIVPILQIIAKRGALSRYHSC